MHQVASSQYHCNRKSPSMFVSFNINAFKKNNNLFSEMQFYFCKKYAVASCSQKNVLYIKKYIWREILLHLLIKEMRIKKVEKRTILWFIRARN